MKELENLISEPTSKTPRIDLNQSTGELILSGKSIPENAAKVYEPVLEWVSEYILNAKPTTNLRLNLEYFNTSSSLWLAKILKVLIKIKDPDFVFIVHLYIPIEDYQEVEESGDIRDVFAPITGIFFDALPSVGIKLYGIDDDGDVIKETLVFI